MRNSELLVMDLDFERCRRRLGDRGEVPGGATIIGPKQSILALPITPSFQDPQDLSALVGTAENPSDSAMGDTPSSEHLPSE